MSKQSEITWFLQSVYSPSPTYSQSYVLSFYPISVIPAFESQTDNLEYLGKFSQTFLCVIMSFEKDLTKYELITNKRREVKQSILFIANGFPFPELYHIVTLSD